MGKDAVLKSEAVMRERVFMKRSKYRFAVMSVIFAVCSSVSAGCGTAAGGAANSAPGSGEAGYAEAELAADQTQAFMTVYTPTESELAETWDDSASVIALEGGSVAVSGGGVTAVENRAVITESGVYVVSGTLEDGQIVIDAAKGDEVRLVLNGADITNQSGAPIEAQTVSKLIVTLTEGSENYLTDGGAGFVYTDEEEPNAALFAKNDLTINGSGALTVKAGFSNGIVAKDQLTVIRGTITVEAANHALRGTDGVTVLGGSFNLTAGNDGIQSGNHADDKGHIQLEGGIFTIQSGHDGIQSDHGLLISGGEYTITAGGGAEDTPVETGTSDSYKGVKAAGALMVSGGTFSIDSADDGLHAGGNLSVTAGDFMIASGDDGIHGDGDVAVSGGTVQVIRSHEALEGANIYISDGILELAADDDGINAAGGSDNESDGPNGRFGRDSFAAGGEYTIAISGGTISFRSGGDGIDSNGTIQISGGVVEAIIESSRDNTALDSDGAVTVDGGTVVAGGTGAVAQIAEESLQSYVYLTELSAGDIISVQTDGTELISYTAEQDLPTLALFAAGITAGERYEVSINGEDQTVTAGGGFLSE